MKNLTICYKLNNSEINDFLTVLNNLYFDYNVENKVDFYLVKVTFQNVVNVESDFDILSIEKECKIDNVKFEIIK